MSILNNFKRLFFYRQHPETALRYLPIVDLIKKNHWENLKILEVGSGSYGIAPYFKKQIVGLDTTFSEPKYDLLKQVKASGDKIPFKDNQFDLVILSDVLEHIPQERRTKTINESIRVASKAVIISGPFGKQAAAQDKKLAEYSLKKLGNMHPYFKDHLEYGLPEVEDLISLKNKKIKEIKKIGEFLNLKVREGIMKIFITTNPLQYYFYLKGLMCLVPIFRRFNRKPCYRTLIIFKLQ